MRSFRYLALIAAIALVAGCQWVSFRNGPEGTGFNASESVLSVSNVGNLTLQWTGESGSGGATTSGTSPAVAGGVVYVTGSVSGKLYAFSTDPEACDDQSANCRPLWTADLTSRSLSSPAVAMGVVFVAANDGRLRAFDADGTENCSGSPKTCTPLWTSPAFVGGLASSSPTVAGGSVFLNTESGLHAFDAEGVAGCSGTPRVCSPVWSSTLGGVIGASPAVANGIVYTTNISYNPTASWSFNAYDAAGVIGCSGTPRKCSPLWTGNTGNFNTSEMSTPAIANGIVYVIGSSTLHAFDAAGVIGCSSNPKVCTPLWKYDVDPSNREVSYGVAVANGIVYAMTTDVNTAEVRLRAFDATGTIGCSQAICYPLWRSSVLGTWGRPSPSVANGVVYVPGADHLFAFDSSGTVGCTGVVKTCAPLWSGDMGPFASSMTAAIANGRVYIPSSSGLRSFGL